MIDAIKEAILDQQPLDNKADVPRNLDWHVVAKKAFVCLGVRRAGKSTLLHQIMTNFKKQNPASAKQIFYINFYDDRLHGLQRSGLALIIEAIWSLYPETHKSKLSLFFDEIQEINGWEPFVERLLREGHDIFITGSSAKMLSKEIATQMRGRSLSWELFPFEFTEFLKFKKTDFSQVSTKKKVLIRNAFDEFHAAGGFPETIPMTRSLRIKIHQEYFHTMLYRDVIERHDVAHPRAVLDLAYRLMSQCSSLYTINRLTEYLRSLGHKIDKSFVASCLDWFEDCFFLFSVKIHDRSLARQNVNPKKIYCVDHALVSSVSPWGQINNGAVLENMIFVSLRRQNIMTTYYRTKNGREVDFFCVDAKGKKFLIQVCHDLKDEKTREREIKALKEAMLELKLKTGLIVTTDKSLPIKSPDKDITIIPAWRFLLESS